RGFEGFCAQLSVLSKSHYFLFEATFERKRASCSLSSGVISAPKSSASNTWRISTSPSPSRNGARLSHSTASSIDRTCHNQKPAISSLDSVKGPSVTVGWPFPNLTRFPFELAWRPSPASMMPAFTSSSLNFPISARSSFLGRMPASESLLALTITMTLISFSPVDILAGAALGCVFDRLEYRPYGHGERALARSTTLI